MYTETVHRQDIFVHDVLSSLSYSKNSTCHHVLFCPSFLDSLFFNFTFFFALLFNNQKKKVCTTYTCLDSRHIQSIYVHSRKWKFHLEFHYSSDHKYSLPAASRSKCVHICIILIFYSYARKGERIDYYY